MNVGPGFYLTPALFVDCKPGMLCINREETLGTVACVTKAGDYEGALFMAIDTKPDLSLGTCKSSLRQATHFRHNEQAGMVIVNVPTDGVD